MEDMAAKNFARFSALFGQETGSANDALLGWLLLPSAASSAASHPNPEPHTPHLSRKPKACTWNRNPKPETLNPKPETLNPKPETLV